MDKTCAYYHRVHCFAGIQFFAKTNWQSKIIFCYHLMCVFMGFIYFFFSSIFILTTTDDLELLIEGACIWTATVVLFISLVICLVFRKNFRNFLVKMVFKDNMMEMPFIEFVMGDANNDKLAELKDLVISSLDNLSKWARLLLKSYLLLGIACISLYLLCCLYFMCVTTDEHLRLLAFDMWFPWSMENFKVYVATFIFNACAGILCCIVLPSFQCTIIFLIGQIVRQLRILKFILENLSELASEISSGNKERWDHYSSKIFVQTVEHYIKLKRFTNRLNVICQPFYLVYLLTAMMVVCVCSVKIATSRSMLSFETLKYWIHELTLTLITFIFCMLGQLVDNECEKLEEVVTNNWYKFNRSHKDNIKIFHRALGQRMPMFIFGSVKLDLSTFIWFLKTGSSFFTLMMSVLEEE